MEETASSLLIQIARKSFAHAGYAKTKQTKNIKKKYNHPNTQENKTNTPETCEILLTILQEWWRNLKYKK